MDLSETRGAEGDWYDDIKLALLVKALGPVLPAEGTILDVGCGQGGILLRLRARSARLKFFGVDPYLPDELISKLAEQQIVASRTDDGVPEQADIVLLMDVLEHVDDPAQLLRDAFAHARAGGYAFITVPAYRWLWSKHDIALGHKDRYSVPRLRGLIEDAGIDGEVRSLGYALPSLLIGAAPVRLLERLGNRGRKAAKEPEGSQLDTVGDGVLSKILRPVGKADAKIFGGKSLAGLTCVALVQKTALP